MPMANSCAECAFMHRNDNTCHRHAPGTTQEEQELTFWPVVRTDSRCGSGQAIGDGTEIVACGWCIHWHQPGGQPVAPDYLQGMNEEWWRQSGYCTRFAPGPSSEEEREVFWKVTHRLSACGDGEEAKKKGAKAPSTKQA